MSDEPARGRPRLPGDTPHRAAQRRWYARNREAALLAATLRYRGRVRTVAECREILADE